MDKILVLDFGGQYNLLIARRVRELHVFAEIAPYNKITVEEIVSKGYRGIIFTGEPHSVYESSSPTFSKEILNAGIPILGICYGCQLTAQLAGGSVTPAQSEGEYGNTLLYAEECSLFENIPKKSSCFMSHTDQVSCLPQGFKVIGHTDKCQNAAFCDEKRKIYGVQFHPEVTHTEFGQEIFKNFLFKICSCKPDWRTEDFIARSVDSLREKYKDKKILLALSGGVDSSVAAALLSRAVGDRLCCVFVDHGLLRKEEGDYVESVFKNFPLTFIRVNARERFLRRLRGVTLPEEKRKIIGDEFVRVFEEEARKLGKTDILAQGTIYPDVVESGKGDSAVIKSHHNVGGLPDSMTFEELCEPLRELFKDEVRDIGEKLGLPSALVRRQPFPGPGLAVRVIGEITEEKLRILKEADAIFREEVAKGDPDGCPDQYFAVLTDLRSVGVKGDAGTYGFTLALRAVTTDDFMTAEWTRLPYDVLARASNRITNEISEITRVVYDITSKPPATVEWE